MLIVTSGAVPVATNHTTCTVVPAEMSSGTVGANPVETPDGATPIFRFSLNTISFVWSDAADGGMITNRVNNRFRVYGPNVHTQTLEVEP